MGVDDQTRDFVVLIGNDGFVQELLQGNIGQRDPRRDRPLRAVGCNPRQSVAGPRRRRLGQEIAQIIEGIAGGIDGMAVDHGGSRPAAPYASWLRPRLSAEEILRSPDRGRGSSCKHLMLLINSWAQYCRRCYFPKAAPGSRRSRMTFQTR